MGTDFKCGCRNSMGHWFLCKQHENELLNKLELYIEEEQDRGEKTRTRNKRKKA